MMSVKTILLVENDQVSQTMYQKRLEREGYHMECAQDGQVALDILSERAPDLVLLDLMLPKVSGADVLRFMQADPRLTTVPVIIFSNAPLTEVPPDSALAQGTKRLLKSDCTFPKLLETIQESLAVEPELVVVEANKVPSTKSARKSKAAIKEEHHQDIIPPPDFDREIPKPLADFLAEAPTGIPKLREHSMGYIKAPETEAGQKHLSGLQQRAHALQASATEAGCARVALLLSAFENVLSGIKDKPAAITPSMLQTIAQAVDCLDGLLKTKDGYSAGPAIHAKVLVVDDDAVCNQVNVTSLKRANFKVDGVKDPAEALTMLESTQYDIVVLDVNMPGLSGFDVCEKMRRLPHNKKTPVIFVTAFSSFDNRKQSVLSGGNDFVSKPVSPVELALKVTINLIKARVEGIPEASLPAQPAAINGASRSPQPKAPGKNDEQISEDPPPAEPPSRLAPLPEAGIRNTRATVPQPEPKSDSAAPAKSGSAGKRDKGEPAGTDIHDRLRQSTAALESARANLEQESAERTRVETQWREQLNAAKALVSQTEAVLKDKEAQNAQLEKDLAGLRKAKDELQDKLTSEQQATAKSQQEIKELQTQLRQRAKELEHTKTTQEERTLQYTRSESELRDQVNKAKAASDAVELARKEKEMRCGQLEKEVAGLQQAREELQGKLAAGQQVAEKLQHEIKELQVGLGQQTAEKMRLETEWRGKFEAAAATAVRTETALKEKSTQNVQLEKDLTGLRKTKDELQDKLTSEQQAAEKLQRAHKEKETRCGQLEKEVTGLQKDVAGLQKDRDELQTKFSAEQQAAEKLQRAHKEKETRCGQLEKEVTGLQKDRDELQTRFSAEQQAAEKLLRAHKEKETRCGQLEKEVAGLQKDRDELQTRFSAEQQASTKSRQESKELGERLQQNITELERTKTGLEQESAKRTRLEAEQQNLFTAKEALNIELRALRETQAAREVEFRNKQKKLTDGLRENIQLLQSKLQEAEALGGDLASAPHGKSKSH
jgi:DNA-binding response OmpR family regulator